mgnify:FL=1
MINVSIFSPHEDKFDFTNRNIIYSQYSKKTKINTTLYVSNFNYKTKKHRKLKNYFYESEVHKKIHIYRIYSTRFHGNGLTRFFSYLTFAFISTMVFYFLDKKKNDFIIGETVPPICSLAAYLCSKKNSSKFIYQVRDPWPTSLVYNGVMKRNSIVFFIFESINKFLISKSNLIISVLPFLESFIRRKYNFKNNFYYLPNGSEVNKIKVSKYPLSINNKINIIYSGGFSPGYRMINLFHAIKILQNKNYNNLNFSFLGSGIDLNLCKKFVNDHKLSNIKFLKPILKKNVFKEISKYHFCLAIVNKTQNEKFGYNFNKIYDYTSCGRPILFTNNYKKNCFIEKNNLGYNCNPDPKDISDHIIKFYKMSHNQRRKMADNSRKYAIKHFNIENLSNNYSKILYFENNSKKIKRL